MNHRCFSPQIQGYRRLAGNPICGSPESAGKLLRSWSQCSMSFKIRVLALAGFLASAASGLGQPTFLFDPDSTSVSPGANVFFQSLAFGDGPIHYQWFKNGVELAGETEDFLFLAQATVADAGDYSVVASTFSGSATSSVVVLSFDTTFIKITTD